MKRVILAVATLLLLGFGLMVYRFTRPPTVVSVDDAVERFRTQGKGQEAETQAAEHANASPSPAHGQGPSASQTHVVKAETAATKASPRRPTDGVYVFNTEGYESTDALTGTRRDYPKQTTSTLKSTECGFNATWSALGERWEEAQFCLEGEGTALRRLTSYHEFFGRGDTQVFNCPAGSYVFFPTPNVGRSWQMSCAGEGSKVDMTNTIAATEVLDIGGQKVETMKIIYDQTLSGRNRGAQKQERWFSLATQVMVRLRSDMQIETDSPLGTVRYEEHYTIHLASLTPRR